MIKLNKIIFILFILIIFTSLISYEKMENKSKYKGEKIIFYNFNTGWCHYSKILQPEWKRLEKYYKNHKKIKIVDIKCEKKRNKDICNKFKVKKYPTLIKVKGGKIIHYNGERKLNKFINFIEN